MPVPGVNVQQRLSMCLSALLFLAHPVRAGEVPPGKSTIDLAQELELSGATPNCAYNAPLLADLVARPDFEEVLHSRQRSMFLSVLAICSYDAADFVGGLEYANRAAAADPESVAAQGMRMTAGLAAGKPADAVDAIDMLSKLRPGQIRLMSPQYVDQVLEAARTFDATGDLELKFFDSLERAQWKLPEMYPDDRYRVAHARLLVQRGRTEEALKRLAPVTDLEYVVGLRAENTFDVLRKDGAFEAQLNLATAVQRGLDRSRNLVEKYPRSMDVVRNEASVLEDSMQFEEELAVIAATLDRFEEDPAAFDDADLSSGWLVNQRVFALYSLGRYDEARESIKHVMRSERVRPADGNILNFASYLMFEGRVQDALELLPLVENTTAPYRVWVESVRTCAAAQLGEPESSKASLAYLRAHEADSAAALSTALLCTNGIDDAAALMIRRLGNRDQRRQALVALQVQPSTRYDELPFRKVIAERFQTVREREDVLSAVKAVGRIEAVPLLVSRSF